MACIHEQVVLELDADSAWAALKLVGNAHALFAPVLVDARLDGDTRTVRFANGMTVREQILDVDEQHRRVAYTVLDGSGLTYHHASMQVTDSGPGRSLFVWITDFLPADAGAQLGPLVEAGTRALKQNLEKS